MRLADIHFCQNALKGPGIDRECHRLCEPGPRAPVALAVARKLRELPDKAVGFDSPELEGPRNKRNERIVQIARMPPSFLAGAGQFAADGNFTSIEAFVIKLSLIDVIRYRLIGMKFKAAVILPFRDGRPPPLPSDISSDFRATDENRNSGHATFFIPALI